MITESMRHLLAHTARIVWTMEEKPQHPRTADYQRQLRIYRGKWAEMSDEEQQETRMMLVGAADCPDMTAARVAAAIAELNK